MELEIETSLMVNDYPEPPEEKTINISGSVYVKYTFEDVEIPASWSMSDIEQDIKENLSEYTDGDYEIEDIEI